MATSYGNIPVIFGHPDQPKALSLEHPKARYGGFHPSTTVLPKGLVKREGCLPLPCDILFERDVPVRLRDGITLRVDVYRPVYPVEAQVKCPAIMGWSPYGKEGGAGNQVLDDFPFRFGVPLSDLSELQKWEAADPGYWVQFGYAVVAPDARGVYNSEGDIYQFGSQEGRDGADVVDWIGTQDWCNGKVATSGNSWLTIAQWFIAAEHPKHLACIAPWEGFSDMFGHFNWLGGVVSQKAMDFAHTIITVNVGQNSWENTTAMAAKYDTWNAFHDDKRAKIEEIDVPAYVVASYGNPIHTYGTFHTWTRLKTEKWLRVHDSWEWPDYYNETSVADLHRFFDHFLKGIDNGWETTPRVRAKIIDTKEPQAHHSSTIQATAWPVPAAGQTKYFLDPANGAFHNIYPSASSKAYKVSSADGLEFTYEFDEPAILAGPIEMKLRLCLHGTNDSDVFVAMEKILTNGKVGSQCKIPFESWHPEPLTAIGHLADLALELFFYKGPIGQARVSRRVVDESESTPGMVIPRFDLPSPAREGEIVTVQPSMWPIGMAFARGEKLRLRIGGQTPFRFPPTDKIGAPAPKVPDINQVGEVTLYGGQTDGSGSYVVLPFVEA